MMDKAIEQALKTWYPIDHELHFNPLHPAIKLAGEAGELLDLYGKHRFKPGFDWWDCKRCNRPKIRGECPGGCVPLVLDELGDWWYYFRILSYLSDNDYDDSFDAIPNIPVNLSWMNWYSANVLKIYLSGNEIVTSYLNAAFVQFIHILKYLNTDLDEITEMNYRKLNSEPTNHGWRDA